MRLYKLYSFHLPAALEDTFSARLWGQGILGLEVRELPERRLQIDAYLAADRQLELPGADDLGVVLAGEQTLAERDWLADYRRQAQPLDIGRFRIDPREAQAGEVSGGSEDDRFYLRIPAQTAFGTGSHESTRLALAWLEDLSLHGCEALDVGTGTGILAFAALQLGAARVTAFDVDPAATLIARRNAELNRLFPCFFTGSSRALAAGAAFDLALINVLPERITADLPHLASLLRRGGRAISSGNLWSDRQPWLRRLARLGWSLEGEKRDGEWVAFLLRAA